MKYNIKTSIAHNSTLEQLKNVRYRVLFYVVDNYFNKDSHNALINIRTYYNSSQEKETKKTRYLVVANQTKTFVVEYTYVHFG